MVMSCLGLLMKAQEIWHSQRFAKTLTESNKNATFLKSALHSELFQLGLGSYTGLEVGLSNSFSKIERNKEIQNKTSHRFSRYEGRFYKCSTGGGMPKDLSPLPPPTVSVRSRGK